MRQATVNGIRAALRARGFQVLDASGTRNFTARWEHATEGDWLPENFPVTEHDLIVTVTEDRVRAHADGRTITQDANRVRITVYSGRFPDATNHAGRIRKALSDYAVSYLYGPMADVYEPDGAYYTVCYTVDENYWDTVAEIMEDRTDVCARDHYTGTYWHAPHAVSPFCEGHWTRFINTPTGGIYTLDGGTSGAVRLREVSTGTQASVPYRVFRDTFTPVPENDTPTSDTAPTPYPEGTHVRILVGAHYGRTGRIVTVRPDNGYTVADDATGEVLPYAHTELDATETITQDDAGQIWHDYRESPDYRSAPTTHSEYRANRNAAVRAALVNSGIRHPSALQVANVSANVLGPDATDVERVIGLIAGSGYVPVHAVGSVWITTTDGEMILNVREGISSLHIVALRDTLSGHGWRTIPITGLSNYAYRLAQYNTAEQNTARADAPGWNLDNKLQGPVMQWVGGPNNLTRLSTLDNITRQIPHCARVGETFIVRTVGGMGMESTYVQATVNDPGIWSLSLSLREHAYPAGTRIISSAYGHEGRHGRIMSFRPTDYTEPYDVRLDGVFGTVPHAYRDLHPETDGGSDGNGPDSPETDPALMGIEPYGPDYRAALTAGMTGDDYYDSGQAEEDARTGREIEDELRGETDEPENDTPTGMTLAGNVQFGALAHAWSSDVDTAVRDAQSDAPDTITFTCGHIVASDGTLPTDATQGWCSRCGVMLPIQGRDSDASAPTGQESTGDSDTAETTRILSWDEPENAHTPRGWLHRAETVIGFYLDYGPDHYRSGHEYCQPNRKCPDCEPGSVLAVRYPDEEKSSHWFVTVAEARAWVENGPQDDAPARTESAPTTQPDDTATDGYGVPCATMGHSDRTAVTRVLITHTDDTYGIEYVCSRCARYYVDYSGKITRDYRWAVIVPDDRVTVNVGYVPGMTISVWPVENVPATDDAPARVRYGYMVEYLDDVLYAGVDIHGEPGEHPAHAAFRVASHIVAEAEHSNINGDGAKDGDCPEHGKAYTVCSAYRDVYAHAENLSMWREDWAGTHGNAWDDMGYVGHFEAIMHDNHECLIGFGKFNGITAEEMIAQYFELVGAGNDFTGPMGDARWHGYLTWAKIIGADHGTRAAQWIDIRDEKTAHKIIAGMGDDVDPEVMDAYTPRVPDGQYADDYNWRQLCRDVHLTEDDESDDGALWSAYEEGFSGAAESEVVRRAREYVS